MNNNSNNKYLENYFNTADIVKQITVFFSEMETHTYLSAFRFSSLKMNMANLKWRIEN